MDLFSKCENWERDRSEDGCTDTYIDLRVDREREKEINIEKEWEREKERMLGQEANLHDKPTQVCAQEASRRRDDEEAMAE